MKARSFRINGKFEAGYDIVHAIRYNRTS